jgi:two-component system NtrC family sensor kinase
MPHVRMRYSVLIVDDDPQIRKLCRLTLQEKGYGVQEATNGKKALAAIEEGNCDLIVLDLSMPDMDGIEFLMAVRAELPKLKIIVMSGFMGGTMLPTAKLLGGAATLPKPFSPESLLSLVDEALAESIPVRAVD